MRLCRAECTKCMFVELCLPVTAPGTAGPGHPVPRAERVGR